MPEIGLFSVGNGDTSYIQHGSDNFTIIDCVIDDGDPRDIIGRLKEKGEGKGIRRFISTHPDDDHIRGIHHLDKDFPILNFYVVANNAIKKEKTESFEHYKKLRDGDKAFFIEKGSTRKWMNLDGDGRGSSGVNILWPDRRNKFFKEALKQAGAGEAFNNMSCVIRYSLNGGASCIWLGDLETTFMENIQGNIELLQTDIVIAAHHGRKSGKIPNSWLDALKPKIIVIGEAASRELNYYSGYNTLTQNRCGDIFFDLHDTDVDIYTSKDKAGVRDWLKDKKRSKYENYIGTLET